MDLREPLGGTPQGPGAVDATPVEEKDKTSLVRSLVGRSRAFRLVFEQIERAAGSDVPSSSTARPAPGKSSPPRRSTR